MDDIFGKIFLPFDDKKDGYTISMGQLFIASDSAAMDVPMPHSISGFAFQDCIFARTEGRFVVPRPCLSS